MVWGRVRSALQALVVAPEQLAAHPVIADFCVDTVLICDVAKVQRLAELGPRNTAVVQSEVIVDLQARLQTLRSSLESGQRLLLLRTASTDERTLLVTALGDIAVRVDQHAGVADPALFAINVVDLLKHTLLQAPTEVIERTFQGMSTHRLSRQTISLFSDSVALDRANWVQRVIRHPSFAVYLVVFLYSALRVVPVAYIREFHGSLVLLWAIDLVTAVPYTWGVLAMVFAQKTGIRLLAAATTLVTFVGPYVYFWLNGDGYPLYVPIVIAALTAITVLLEVRRYWQEKALRKRYQAPSSYTSVVPAR